MATTVASARSGAEQGYILIRNKDWEGVLGLGNISRILENVADLVVHQIIKYNAIKLL